MTPLSKKRVVNYTSSLAEQGREKTPDWEEEFDRLFRLRPFDNGTDWKECLDTFKRFIRSLLSSERERAFGEVEECMFKETLEGQTHSENDGCGEPAHNSPTPQEAIIKEFENKFWDNGDLHCSCISSNCSKRNLRDDIKSFLLTSCRSEYRRGCVDERKVLIEMTKNLYVEKPNREEDEMLYKNGRVILTDL